MTGVGKLAGILSVHNGGVIGVGGLRAEHHQGFGPAFLIGLL